MTTYQRRGEGCLAGPVVEHGGVLDRDRLAVRTQRPFAKTVMTMRGALGLLAIVLCAVLHGRCCLGASVRRRGDISSGDNNLLVSNNDNSDRKALPPKPQYVCPAMDMLHIRKVGPSPIMLRDGTTFNPDELIRTFRMKCPYWKPVHTIHWSACHVSGTPYPSLNVFPTMKGAYRSTSVKTFSRAPSPHHTLVCLLLVAIGEFLLVLTAMEQVQPDENMVRATRVSFCSTITWTT